jgi:branched-chain amino acid aminotransferase
MQPQVYFRNEIVPASSAMLSIASSAVLYGLSIYTVFPVFYTKATQQLHAFRLPDHFKRLQNSAKIMGFTDFLTDWDYERFESDMRALIEANNITEDSLVRVTIFVDEILGGTKMHGLKHSVAAFIYSAVSLLPEDGAHLCVSNWRRTPDNAIPSRAKVNGSYVNAALMKNEALLSGFDDAIALDESGHVAESTVANIFMVRDGTLVTPTGSTDLLEGITRDTVLQLAKKLNIPSIERAIDRSEIYLADEIFLSGSSMRLSPVTKVDHRTIGNGTIGVITKELQAAYKTVAHNAVPAFEHWTVQVA